MNVCTKLITILLDAYAIIFSGLIYTGWIWFITIFLVALTAEFIIGIIENDLIGWFGMLALGAAQPHMIHQGLKYKGLTQSMSLWHWQSFVLWIIYVFYRLLNGNTKDNNNSKSINVSSQITYSNQPALYITTIITLICVIINDILDLIAVYKWYFAKNRVILRPNFILNRYHARDEILDKTANEEWLMKNGVSLSVARSVSVASA